MSLLTFILICFNFLSVSVDAECTVTGCNSTLCDGNNCSQCISPYYRYSSNLCQQCYLNCHRCDDNLCYKCVTDDCTYACEIADCPSACPGLQNVNCPNCPDGFYKHTSSRRCFRCLNTGCKCSSASDCIDCFPGRYNTSTYCEHACPGECITCASADNCSKCVTGKYGPACASDCIYECKDGGCDKDFGNCTCLFNQYWDESAKKCQSCRSRCKSCINFNQCTLCLQPNYWGPICEHDCVGCGGICNKTYGCSEGCDDEYYQTMTDGSFSCTRCPRSCKKCTSSIQCNTCKSGYWGNECQYNCTGCKDVCNKNNGCDAGCQAGFFQKIVTFNSFQCIACFENCENCLLETDCLKCFNGYYLKNNNSCVSCPNTCKNNICNQFNGSCLDGCVDGHTGEQCESRCPSNCLLCDMHNSDTCIQCDIGFYGDNCNPCSIHCKTSVEAQTCNKANGTCKYGCTAGNWGTMCTETCSNRCQGLRCNETTGACLDGCNTAYYGQHCEHDCSPNCVKETVWPRLCNEQDGSCPMGCSPGFYGINCSAVCSNCRNMVCFQHNGTCELGCTDGFTGAYCNEETGKHNVLLINQTLRILIFEKANTGM